MDDQPMSDPGQQPTDQTPPPAGDQASACTECSGCTGYVDDGAGSGACATCTHAKLSHPNA
ncbi:MAG TPA: hypothetical protein VNG90_01715 [Candidatus Acidoferrum sp.]|nr:hypothetical protein [Candidatus Acidoferrum sp.]